MKRITLSMPGWFTRTLLVLALFEQSISGAEEPNVSSSVPAPRTNARHGDEARMPDISGAWRIWSADAEANEDDEETIVTVTPVAGSESEFEFTPDEARGSHTRVKWSPKSRRFVGDTSFDAEPGLKIQTILTPDPDGQHMRMRMAVDISPLQIDQMAGMMLKESFREAENVAIVRAVVAAGVREHLLPELHEGAIWERIAATANGSPLIGTTEANPAETNPTELVDHSKRTQNGRPASPMTAEMQRLHDQLPFQESAAATEAEAIRQLQANGQAESNSAAIAEHQRKLTALLSTAFDLKLQLEELQIKDQQSRLSQLERQIGQRKALRDKIIQRRATELIEDESLKWTPTARGSANPTPIPEAPRLEPERADVNTTARGKLLLVPDSDSDPRPTPSGVSPSEATPVVQPDSMSQAYPSSSLKRSPTLTVLFVKESEEGGPPQAADASAFDRVVLRGPARNDTLNPSWNYKPDGEGQPDECIFWNLSRGHYTLEVDLNDGWSLKRSIVVRDSKPQELTIVFPRSSKAATLLVAIPPLPKELLRDAPSGIPAGGSRGKEPLVELRIRVDNERQIDGSRWSRRESNDQIIRFDPVTGKPTYILGYKDRQSTVKSDLTNLKDEDRLIFMDSGPVQLEWTAYYTGQGVRPGGWELETAKYPSPDSDKRICRVVEPGENHWQLEFAPEFLAEVRRVFDRFTPKSGTAECSVNGLVTRRGKPVAGKVFFHSDGNLFGAKVNDEGKFIAKGVQAGQYKVTVVGEGIPEKFTLKDATPLIVELKEGNETIGFDLE